MVNRSAGAGRQPVVVGAAGVVQHCDSSLDSTLDAAGLMAAACVAAAGHHAEQLLPQVGLVAVPRGTWKYSDAGRLVARAIGAERSSTLVSEVGILQSDTLIAGIQAVAEGRVESAVVIGGEALDRRRQARKANMRALETVQVGEVPDVVQAAPSPFVGNEEESWGIREPYLQYVLVDSARRHRLGIEMTAHRQAIARRYEQLSRVAVANPAAWERSLWSADELLDTSRPGNRMLAYPYSVKTVTQMYLDQAAALLICTEAEAKRLGVPEDRWVYPEVGVGCSHVVPLANRADPSRNDQWVLMSEAVEKAAGRPVASYDLLDLYNCFPVALDLQCDAFGISADRVPSVTGGMSFGGGGFNHAAIQAFARAVELIQEGAGSNAFVTANSGYLTKQGAVSFARDRPQSPFQALDLTPRAGIAVRRRSSVLQYSGPAEIEGVTVLFERNEPARAFALVRTGDGEGTIVSSTEDNVLAAFLESDWVGQSLRVDRGRARL
ncbi:hypothetical protein [Nocardia sp. CA-120079]|uniref:hypothetical protein n=1 Tax=Nocardia sp. CA-120079 TaxID=3239974 RepID=UPI003D96CA7B